MYNSTGFLLFEYRRNWSAPAPLWDTSKQEEDAIPSVTLTNLAGVVLPILTQSKCGSRVPSFSSLLRSGRNNSHVSLQPQIPAQFSLWFQLVFYTDSVVVDLSHLPGLHVHDNQSALIDFGTRADCPLVAAALHEISTNLSDSLGMLMDLFPCTHTVPVYVTSASELRIQLPQSSALSQFIPVSGSGIDTVDITDDFSDTKVQLLVSTYTLPKRSPLSLAVALAPSISSFAQYQAFHFSSYNTDLLPPIKMSIISPQIVLINLSHEILWIKQVGLPKDDLFSVIKAENAHVWHSWPDKHGVFVCVCFRRAFVLCLVLHVLLSSLVFSIFLFCVVLQLIHRHGRCAAQVPNGHML